MAQASVDPQGIVVAVNAAWCELFGSSPESVEGRHLLAASPDEHLPENRAFVEAFLSGDRLQLQEERRLERTDGTPVDVLVSASTVRDQQGRVMSHAIFLQDITARACAEHALELREERWRALVTDATDLALIADEKGTLLSVTPSAEQVLGFTDAEMMNRSGFDWIHPDDRPLVADAMERVVGVERGTATFTIRVRHRDGSWRWVEERLTNLLDHPAVGGVVANLRDVTEQRAVEERLRDLALYDGLTGLPNATLLRDRVDRAVTTAGELDSTVLAVVLDLAGFGTINQAHGREGGDQLLRQVAQRLTTAMGLTDTVARTGGDEFAILMDTAIPGHDTGALARRLGQVFGEPFDVAGQPVRLTASVGVAEHPPSAPAQLLSDASLALGLSKRKGSAMERFSPSLRTQLSETLATRAELRTALGQPDRLVPWFQPVVALEDGAVLGWEALVRWRHPTRGLLPPADFLPVADEAGLLTELSTRVLELACAHASTWPASWGYVAVNVGAGQLLDPRFPQLVEAILTHSGLLAERLVLEVTEIGVLVDPALAAASLASLRQHDVRVAVDDFGTGYSSLLQLTTIPADVVKIDQVFVDGMTVHRSSYVVVASTVALARRMRVACVAEGVETAQQAAALLDLGCEAGQGFLWSPAVPPAEMAAAVERLEEVWRLQAHRRRGSEHPPAVVDRVRELSGAGLSTYSIAAVLNREGLRTLEGRRWTHVRTLEVLLALGVPT